MSGTSRSSLYNELLDAQAENIGRTIGYDKLLELKDLEETDNANANWLWMYLADISRIDKESDMFRNHFSNNLKVLFDEQTHISLVATHDNMNKAYTILCEMYKTGNFTEQEYEACLPQLIIEGDIIISKVL